MSLPEFIEDNVDVLVAEWDRFARAIRARGAAVENPQLRSRGRQLLLALANDMRSSQSPTEQEARSKGLSPERSPGLTRRSHAHATERFHQGFNLNQLVAEYRALRASVIRLWGPRAAAQEGALEDLIRFDEAIDQSLTESVKLFSTMLEQARELFIGALGHDLRAPLTAICFSVDFLMLRESGLGGEEVRAVVRISNSVDRIQRMIDQLLDFTRTRLGGTMTISPEPFDLGELCRCAADEFRPSLAEGRIVVKTRGELLGLWDRTRMEETVSNLIANALDHGSDDAAVTVDLREAGKEVTLAIHNEGEPIPADVQRVIFDPLVRGGLLGRHGQHNLGLGLYIAKQVVDAHGGSIEVSSNARDGTTFVVRLPRRPPADEPAPSSAAAENIV